MSRTALFGRRPTFVPELERLETRTVPATVPLTVHVTGVGVNSSASGAVYADVLVNGVEQSTRGSQEVIAGSVFVNWSFTFNVDTSGPAQVTLGLLHDLGGDPLFDQILDINPKPGEQEVSLTVDPLTGYYTGDLAWPNSLAQGDGDGTTGNLSFGISINGIDSTRDSDGDGLPDLWEMNGLDLDGNRSNGVDLPLNTWGADPNHKDLFLEYDWMPGAVPSREAINSLKDAFAVAPIDAGTNAAALPGGIDAKLNPDGKPGINLHVDTGSLTDATGQLVGDNLGGGNQVPTTNISNLNANFYAVKSANFNANRALVFRYGISATAPTNTSGTSTGGNSGTTLNDTSQSWVPGEWAGYSVTITGGTGAGQPAIPITANTATQLTLKSSWATTPDATSTYSISWSSGGWGEIGGNDFIEFNHDAGTIMHEFGHTLNLQHGGFEGTNRKPNYVSAMNYDDQFGIPQNSGATIIDYSPAKISFGGTSTGANNATTFNDTTQSWAVNQWAGGYVELVVGGVRETRLVTSNTATQLVLSQAWSAIPANNTAYALYTATQPRSAAPLPAITESALDETQVLGPTDNANRMIFSDGNYATTKTKVQYPLDGTDRNGDGTIDGPDYNGDGKVDTSPVSVNLNADFDAVTSTTPFAGQNDWQDISLPFRQFGDSSTGAIDPETDPPLTLVQSLQQLADLDTADLALGATTSAGTVDQGSDLTYTYTASVNGPSLADGVIVTDTLPAGVDYVSSGASQGTSTFDGSTVTWRLGSVYPGSPVTFTLKVVPQLVGTLTNTATATSLDNDPNTSNNSAAPPVTVLNVPPKVTSVSLDRTVINENDTVTLTVKFTDPGRLDTHTATIDWGQGEGSPQVVPITPGARELTVTHQYLDDNPTGTPQDDYSIGVTVTDNNGGSGTGSVGLTVKNVPPTLSNVAVTPAIDENGTVTLTGNIADVGTLDTFALTVDWGEGSPQVYNYAAGTTSFSVTHQYLDDNPTGTPQDYYPINVTLADDDTGTASASVKTLVKNVPPVITSFASNSPSSSLLTEGDVVSVSGTFTDVGTQDTHTATVDWDDGTVTTAVITETGGSGSLLSQHAYAAGGIYTVRVTLADDDTGTATATKAVFITGVGVHTLPNGQTALEVVGTNGDDHVTINQQGNGQITVHTDFLPDKDRTLSAAGIQVIDVVLLGGDDTATISGGVSLPAILDGGSGDDHLNGGNAGNILIGGGGNDTLTGGSARDILIGGMGADRLNGNGGDDILIGGGTAYDSGADDDKLAHDVALLQLLAEWSSARSYADRVANLRNGTGPILGGTGLFLKMGVTVFDDLSADLITGAAGTDWFFVGANGRVTDQQNGESIN